MNIQRLLAISNSVADELQRVELLELMQALSSQLRAAINSPSESTQRDVQSTRETLEAALREAESNSMSPGMRMDLDSLKINGQTPVSELIGIGLLGRLDKAFDTGGYVSVGSLDQIDDLTKDIEELHGALKQLNSGAEGLALHTEQLEPGESVVGITIPRDAIDEELARLQAEIGFFSRLVTMITEAAEGSPGDPVKVRTLQSSDFAIDLATSISVAAGMAQAVEYLVRALRKLGKIRKVKDEMDELGLEKEFLDAMDAKGNAAIEAEIDEIDAEIFQEQQFKDDGRIREVRTGIKLHLKGLAARLERGYSVEVRTKLPAKPTQDDHEKEAAISALSQVRFERTKPLLKLTDGDDEWKSPERAPSD